MVRIVNSAEGLIGYSELNRQLKNLDPRKQANAIRNAVRAAMKPIEQEAKATVPTGTVPHKTYKGRLVAPGFASRSIVRLANSSPDRAAFFGVVGVRAEAFYAVQFWEWGSYGRERTPWLSNAFDRRRKESTEMLRRELKKKIIDQALKK